MANVVREPCDEAVILSRSSATPCQKKAERWILATTILASSMAFIDGTVVNVALPFLQSDLQVTAIGMQWVVEAYLLFLSALLLVGGSLGDRYGRRRIFLLGVSIFALASAWCGFAFTIAQLIVARAIQGVGAALLVPGSLAIISASFLPERRGRAIGTWSGFSAITTAIGPVLGGWLIEHFSWRAAFFINLPFGLAVLAISLWYVPESRDQNHPGPLDWPGALFAILGLGGLVYGLIESSRVGFFGWSIAVPFIGGLMALAAFFLQEARTESAMLPLELFRSRNFAGANILTLLLYFSLGGGFFFLTLNLIQVQGFSATAAGAALLPFVLIMFSLSRWSGGLIERFGPRLPLLVGPLLAAIGFALFTIAGTNADYWFHFLPGMVVLGLGMALSVAPLTTTVMSSVQESRAGVASGINNAISRAAGLLAIAVLGVVMLQVFSRQFERRLTNIDITKATQVLVYNQRIKLAALELPESTDLTERHQIERAIRESFVAGYRVIMVLASLIALASIISTWFLIENKKR